MTGETQDIRASDAERERIAQIVQQAGAEGRLTLTETEERLGAVYAAKYVRELTALTADLPSARPQRPRTFRPHPALRVHLAIVLALALLLVLRWSVSDAPFFWPIAPIFWLAMSVFVHARIRGAGRRHGGVVPY